MKIRIWCLLASKLTHGCSFEVRITNGRQKRLRFSVILSMSNYASNHNALLLNITELREVHTWLASDTLTSPTLIQAASCNGKKPYSPLWVLWINPFYSKGTFGWELIRKTNVNCYYPLFLVSIPLMK